MAATGSRRRDQVSVAVVVALLIGLFLVNSASWLSAGFGESHDGRNAAAWGAASQAIRTQGPIESRFGGRHHGAQYASHPPGLIAETTAAELIGGEHRLATRAPAWLGSIAAAGLLALLLWELGLSPGAIALGLGVSLSSAMFLVYGTMLDTPVTSLPFAIAVVLAAQRTIDGRRTRPLLLGALGLLVGLSGWCAIVIAGAQVIRLALPSVRRRTGWAPAASIAGGTALGVSISFAWSLWVYGSFATMQAKLTDKSSSVTLAASIGHQLTDLRDLYAVGAVLAVIGAAAALVALPDRRWQGAFASVAGPIAIYAIVFRGGAHMHDYWNYAVIVPIAIAVAAGAETVLRRASAEARDRAQMGTIALALLLALASSTQLSDAEAQLRNGLATIRLLDAATAVAPPEGPVLAFLAPAGMDSPWISYESGRPGNSINGTGELQDLVDDDPSFPVLVAWVRYPEPAQLDLHDVAYDIEGPYAVVPAWFVLEQSATT